MAVDPDIVRRLASALGGGPPLRLALLFGSAAAGALRPELCEACGREVEVVRLDRATTWAAPK